MGVDSPYKSSSSLGGGGGGSAAVLPTVADLETPIPVIPEVGCSGGGNDPLLMVADLETPIPVIPVDGMGIDCGEDLGEVSTAGEFDFGELPELPFVEFFGPLISPLGEGIAPGGSANPGVICLGD